MTISKGDEPEIFYPVKIYMTVEVAALLESKEAQHYLKQIDRAAGKLKTFINENTEHKSAFSKGEEDG